MIPFRCGIQRVPYKGLCRGIVLNAFSEANSLAVLSSLFVYDAIVLCADRWILVDMTKSKER